MAEALKEVYSKEFFNKFCDALKLVVPEIQRGEFLKQIFSPEWEILELKQRMSHIAQVLKKVLDQDFKNAVSQIIEIIEFQRERDVNNGFNFEFMFFPDYIQQYGLDDFETSVSGIEKITQYTSCEFVVRHFILKYPDKMVSQMYEWARHEHAYVRRLASEGMRTRLPWAIGVPKLKDNPDLIVPILDKLVKDESEWVRRSVANSLNDLSKDYPEISLNFTKKWIGNSIEVDKTLKHGARGLLKKGNPEMLGYFGLNTYAKIDVSNVVLRNSSVKIGDYLDFSFMLTNHEKNQVALRIEYRIHFLRSNGTYHVKTFKISEKELASEASLKLVKRHSFKIISTRKYYTGTHYLSLLINGKESEKKRFELVEIA